MLIYNIFGKTRTEFEAWVGGISDTGKAKDRARHLFREVYRNGAKVSKDLREIQKDVFAEIEKQFDFELPLRIAASEQSDSDGSIKFICELSYDKNKIETVLIPERGRLTICLSTQVGCAQACRFCSTGRMGLMRSLTAEEIVAQFVMASRWIAEQTHSEIFKATDKIRNVVFMGMGEPLDNLDNVIRACDIFCDGQGFGLSPNRVTVSTVGILPQLEHLLKNSSVSIALSLHSPFDAERSKIMPVNLTSPIADVLALLRQQNAPLAPWKKRTFFIQYTLIRNVNDSNEHAHALANLLEGVDAKINLIPLNEHSGTAMRRPDLGRVSHFQSILKAHGFVATVRISKGRDILAACGQLINKETVHNEQRRSI